MSRLALTIKNAWIALVFHFIYIIAQFYSRNVFLDILGDDFMGVVGTLKSILQFLNLSELGIGAAVGFSLYKPIYEKNHSKINEIIGYLGFLYKRIGVLILVIGLILLIFFPAIFDKVNINLGIIIFLFLSLLFSNLLSFFFAYHSFLLESDQKGYMHISIGQSVFVIRLIFQCIVLIYFENIILWILLELLMPLVYLYFLRKRIKKTYPWLVINFKVSKEIRAQNRALLTKIKQLSFHKIGGFVSNGTDNIVVFTLINSASVAFVGNYQMIMNNVNTLVSQFFNGTYSGVGNLVAENDLKKMLSVFWELMALRFFLAGCAAVILYLGFDQLIILWIGEKYLMSQQVLIALIIIFFILQVRTPVDTYIQAYGLYADVWAPLVQSSINLIFSVILVINYGVIGIFLGTIISQIAIILIWRPYYLFSSGFKLSVRIYWKGFLLHSIILSVAFAIFYHLNKLINLSLDTDLTIFELCLMLFRAGGIFISLYFFILYCSSNGFRGIIKRLKNHLIKSFH